MADLVDVVFRLQEGSRQVYVYQNALVQVYESGTSNLVTEVASDKWGNYYVASLPTGKYDIKVDGQLRKTIHHVTADHTHTPDRILTWHAAGTISSDLEESSARPVFVVPAAGSIISIEAVFQHLGATGDAAIHLLGGASDAATALTLASNTLWSYRFQLGVEKYRAKYVDSAPALAVTAGQAFTIGANYTAGTVEGASLVAVFRPS